MIAEDSESVRFALRLVLEYFGHEVVGQATDGESAIELYRRIRPELVLLDVLMPGMDGLTCAQSLARINPAIKMVIVTAGATTPRQAVAAGAWALVEKPFDLEEFGQLMESVAAAA
jgi:two-component system chemotaxis response regulator CheY